MTDKEYKITKDHCLNIISGVCDACGGILTPLETVDNAGDPTFWAGCERCQKFCWGVDEKVYKVAEIMVKELNYIYYDHLGYKKKNDDGYQYWLESQISGACSLLRKVKSAEKILNEKESRNDS